ncbi:suppressor of fused domain protein [Planctomicrobium piriforme]|uniref:Suppressor of fused protein (SUFU) n=1 Tax=Planctomicrobium piriforme TaxID=1576369 RepID=A0A1I3B329_9PLAN|nr:suppressor of fused domain protein [Planctomicrobium piriforme]SFH56590.1 Suppressor of fused protein (SUFU) [Planctomicrobium piriforme]
MRYVLVAAVILAGFLAVRWLFSGRPQAEIDDWAELWNARQALLESILGPAEDIVHHAPVPFELGGDADVLEFTQKIPGVTYVTADLTGSSLSKPNTNGQYELMICLREKADWAPYLLSRLGAYTCGTVLEPNDTMDIALSIPQPTNLTALLYVDYASIVLKGRRAGLLLCLGITADELELARNEGVEELLSRLKKSGVYPYTDLARSSVLK